MNDLDLTEILFIDIESYNNDKNNIKVREIGIVFNGFELLSSSAIQIDKNLDRFKIKYICGHNILVFDKYYIENTALNHILFNNKIIDTLNLSLLFFPEKDYHSLDKVYKDFKNEESTNNPLEDAKLSKGLFFRCISKFKSLNYDLKLIYYYLLKDNENYKSFFTFLDFKPELNRELLDIIYSNFKNEIQKYDKLSEALDKHKTELAHIIAFFTNPDEKRTFPHKVLFDYKNIQQILSDICFNENREIENLEIYADRYFGFNTFREFEKANNNSELFDTNDDNLSISQRDIVASALKNENILAVLPTGGGKTFAFWLPAIIKAKKTRAMTIIISPLQALMQDHINSFNKKLSGISNIAAISGYLSLFERRSVIHQIMTGSLDILYLAPESLRNKNIETLLSHRYIDRIVIDEAHCLSIWGNDFRHDYFYIAEFIQNLTRKNSRQQSIAVSCFTATANYNTLNEIKDYFSKALNIKFKEFIASSNRQNLTYHSFLLKDEKEKMMSLIKNIKNNYEPTLIYNPASRHECENISSQLSNDLNRNFIPFHAGLDSNVKIKALNDFIKNNVEGIVATTAFGMGIDKPDIRNVYHYEISSSLEDYSQESGRAGRDFLPSSCTILYTDNDFKKLFFSLIRQKITHQEIKKIFQAIKEYKGRRNLKEKSRRILVSIKELANKVGIETDKPNSDSDTKIKTGILELERCNYLKRKYNRPKVYISSFNFDSMSVVHNKLLDNGFLSSDNRYKDIVLLSQTILKRGSRKIALHIEDLAELINVDTSDIYSRVAIMRDLGLVSLDEDLILSKIKTNELKRFVINIQMVCRVLSEKLVYFANRDIKINEINNFLREKNIDINNYFQVLTGLLKKIAEKGIFDFYRLNLNSKYWFIKVINRSEFKSKLHFISLLIGEIAKYILTEKKEVKTDETTIISYQKMVHDCNNRLNRRVRITEYDDIVIFFKKLKLILVEGGRVVYDNSIEIIIKDEIYDLRKQYTKEDYKKRMIPLYDKKRESLHIMNYFTELLYKDKGNAKLFFTDYFSLKYDDFIEKYGLKKKISLPVPQKHYEKIIQGLTSEQKAIVNDKKTETMLIIAGPGTGKTKILINKIANMILNEDYKPNHFLMLTYTKSAAMEFKQRLIYLLGDLAYEIEIHTYHSFATSLAGVSYKNGNLNNELDAIIPAITEKLKNNDLDLSYKNAIVLDEFQDTNDVSFEFIKALYSQYSEMKTNSVRLIAVGDDDQCIMEKVNGADIQFMNKFIASFDKENDKKKIYKLSVNFRSNRNIVMVCNTFAKLIKNRVDLNKEIIENPENFNNDKVEIIRYKSQNFLPAVYDFVKESDALDIGILMHENNTVLDMYSMLKNDPSIDVSYQIKNEGFRLYMLDEIEAFSQYLKNNIKDNGIILLDLFDDAKKFIRSEYANSMNLELALNHIWEFEKDNDLYTLSFWENYIFETNVGVLKNIHSKIVVSTIHRAKGKEFDEVHVILQNKHHQNSLDYFHRLYYVAMSRAKRRLIIHTNQDSFDGLNNLQAVVNSSNNRFFLPPKKRTFIMQLLDSNLGFLMRNCKSLEYVNQNKIIAGEEVELIKNDKDRFFITHNNIKIGETSKWFSNNLINLGEKGYNISLARIEFVVNWKNRENGKFYKIFLCRIESIQE